MQHLTLPDGTLPTIGDTKVGLKGDYAQPHRDLEVLDYTESGYCIVRGNSTRGLPFHLIFKCAHLSDYHRHDDDLSILFWFEDECVLCDGGLGSYSEYDERRAFLRSGYAHSTIFPIGLKAVRKRHKLKDLPQMSLAEGKVIGESSAYGYRIRRTIEFGQIRDGELSIIDEIVGDSQQGLRLCVNFFFGAEYVDAQTRVDGFSVGTKTHHVSIYSKQRSTGHYHFAEGWSGDRETSAITSGEYGHYLSAFRASILIDRERSEHVASGSGVASSVTVRVMPKGVS